MHIDSLPDPVRCIILVNYESRVLKKFISTVVQHVKIEITWLKMCISRNELYCEKVRSRDLDFFFVIASGLRSKLIDQ